jgi:hypothetical protein
MSEQGSEVLVTDNKAVVLELGRDDAGRASEESEPRARFRPLG